MTVFKDAVEQTCAAATTLFRRDDRVSSMYLVRMGRVTLTRVLPNGTELVLDIAGAGSPVAEASLFSDRYHCDARCSEHATLAILPKETVRANLMTGDFAFHAMCRTAGELQNLRARIEIMRLRRIRDRLDAYLALIGPPAPGCWVEVADWIGVTPAALYRELSRRRGETQ